MYQCIICFIRYIGESNIKIYKNMEKKIFMALGLHLIPEFKLWLLICLICYIEGLIMVLILRWQFIHLGKKELIWLFFVVVSLSHTMFMVDHLTFFITIFYVNNILYLMYYVCKKYPDKVEVETLRIIYLKKDPIKNKELIEQAEKRRTIEFLKAVERESKRKKWW